MNLVVHALAKLRLSIVIVHDVQAFVDGLFVLQRKHHPAAQQAAAHGTHRTVYHVEQRLAVVLHGLHQLQRTDGELIQTHVFILLDTRYRCDMGYLRMLCLFQVLQDGTGSDNTALQVVHTKALQVLNMKVFQQLLTGRLVRKHPVVELEGKEFRTKLQFKVLLPVTFEEHLLWREVTQQLLHIVGSALACEEFSRRDIEESHAQGRLPEVYTGQEVVLLVVQYIIRECHAGCHQFRDAALHQFLRQLRVFQLVADGHTLTGTNQFWQIGIQCMMREAGHLVALHPCPIITVGQRDAQDLGCCDGILAVGLIEVATAEQHHCVRMFRLQVEKLLHHRGQFPIFLCHSLLNLKQMQRYD